MFWVGERGTCPKSIRLTPKWPNPLKTEPGHRWRRERVLTGQWLTTCDAAIHYDGAETESEMFQQQRQISYEFWGWQPWGSGLALLPNWPRGRRLRTHARSRASI